MDATKPIAVQLYTVRDALANDWQGTLEQIAEMGYVGVETAGFDYAESVQQVADKLEQLGLEVAAAHSPLPLGPSAVQALEAIKILGSRRLVCGGTGHDKFSTLDDINERAALFNEANTVCKANGLTFGLHNHWWEYQTVNGHIAYDILREKLDDDIFFEVDTYWAASAGQDPVREIKKLGDRAALLHIKDGSTRQYDDMVAVGDGSLNFREIIQSAGAAEWLIVELDRCATNMLTAVQQSYTYLTTEGLARGKK